MRKIIVKIFIVSVMPLFYTTDLQAQYTVFQVKGTVSVSVDGKDWHPLKKKDELKDTCRIKMLENSQVDIIDSTNLVYSYTGTKIVSVGDIVKQRKTIFEAMNENAGKRKAIGGIVRGGEQEEPVRDAYLLFTVVETLSLYDHQDRIPEGAVFYMTIMNPTEEDKILNVCQELENKEMIPCFPTNIKLGKKSKVEIKELLFGKQRNQKFIITYSEER